MHRMQQVQHLQNKRLQQALNSVAELKKRLEDVDAKNREISENIRHISGGEPTKTDKINKTTTSTNETSTDVKETTTACILSTSSAVRNTMDSNLMKRHIDEDAQFVSNITDDEKNIKSDDNCDVQVKKSKLQS